MKIRTNHVIEHSVLQPFLLMGSLFCLLSSTAAVAAPTVSGQTISWPDDGWYQVQSAETYTSVCEGGLSCDVDPGSYIVINHTTGTRYTDIVVEADTTDGVISINGNTISWPDDGWYQVQDASTYESVCEGGRGCTVPAGVYHVINLTSGQRYEFQEVAGDDNPGTDSQSPSAPANARLTIYSGSKSRDNVAELIWERAPDSENIVGTEVYRDGELIGVSEGNSYLDGFRMPRTSYWYELIAVNVDGERSPTGTLDVSRELAILEPDHSSQYSSLNEAVLQGNTAIFGKNFNSAVDIYDIDTDTGELSFVQQLIPEIKDTSGWSETFGQHTSLDGDNLIIPGLDDSGEGDFFNRQLYVYALSEASLWENTQIIHSKFDEGRAFDIPVLDGNTLMVTSTNQDFNTELVVFEKGDSGQWTEVSRLALNRFDRFDNWVNDIDIDGDTAVISLSEGIASDSEEDYSAAVVLTRQDSGNWVESQRLVEASRTGGFSVFIEAGKIVVLDDDMQVRVFVPDEEGSWTSLSVSTLDLMSGGYVGASGSKFNGQDLLLSATRGDGLIKDSGYLQVFTLTPSGDWETGTRLVASVPTWLFSVSVSLDGDHILSSASRLDPQRSGYFLHKLD